jgi:hypothetical protein
MYVKKYENLKHIVPFSSTSFKVDPMGYRRVWLHSEKNNISKKRILGLVECLK